jgi:hypothetical protein
MPPKKFLVNLKIHTRLVICVLMFAAHSVGRREPISVHVERGSTKMLPYFISH